MIDITRPTAILQPEIVRRNIQRMAVKAEKSGVRFRPHFKTHQSAAIGEWFREVGVEHITVSSVAMAEYFARAGWTDITIAFPVNPLEIDAINALAKRINLNLIIDSEAIAEFLRDNLQHQVMIWVEIDTGYHRTGMLWYDHAHLRALAEILQSSHHMHLCGLLTHAGHSYKARTGEGIRAVYDETVKHLDAARVAIGMPNLELSLGDTPCCAVVDDFSAVNEIRPGNFVFFDVMQAQIGSCAIDDIGVAVAVPVVSVYKDRVVVYGGAVHLSKDRIINADGNTLYGLVAKPTKSGWAPPLANTYMAGLSQEHGTIRSTDRKFLNTVKIGDLLMILPIHSCLTVNLLKGYVTPQGVHIDMADIT